MVYGYNNAANAYKKNSVNHASKEQVLLMLVDAAVKSSKKARYNIESNQVQDAHDNLTVAQDIFCELMATLDVNMAGDWGQRLFDVYKYITSRLGEANIKKDIKILDEIIPLIEDVRNTWHEAYKISKGVK